MNKEKAKEILEGKLSKESAEMILNLRNYLEKKYWRGASYAASAILYICLKEQGYDPVLCLGKCLGFGENNVQYVYNSGWVELDGKVIDICADMINEDRPAFSTVVLGIDTDTGKETDVKYGVFGDFSFVKNADLTRDVFKTTDIFDTIMNIPDYRKIINEKDGLWTVAGKILSVRGTMRHLKEKYPTLPWKYVERYRLLVTKNGTEILRTEVFD